jgi:hypothetical protein
MEIKKEIIITATHLFKKQGIKLTSIDNICIENKILKKTFYRYFKDKEILVNYIYEQTFRNCYLIIKNINESSKNSIESTFRIFDVLFEFYETWDDKTVSDISTLYPFIWKKYLFNNEVLIKELLVPNLKKGCEQGYYKKHSNEFSTGVFWLNHILKSRKIESCEMNKSFFIKGLLTEKGINDYFQNEYFHN